MIHKNWQDLIKPRGLEMTPGRDPKRIATAVAEPLERGFGLTLGNALRRVLLSSLQGAAITAVQIDGVLHEFSSVPGVREDVTDIVLNLKGVALRMDGDGPKRLQLSARGPGRGDGGRHHRGRRRQRHQQGHVICHLDEGASFHAELTVATGKGYVAADKNRPEDAPIGYIPIDALYSPVRKASYKVDPTREGQVLDYDRLAITVETDGSLTPGRCAGLCRADPAGPAADLHQFRGAARGRPRGRGQRSRVQPAAAQEGGRARAQRCARPTA